MLMSRAAMQALFQIGISAADPRAAVHDSLRAHPIPEAEKLFIIAFGKAASAMSEAALSLLPGPARAIVVTNYENATAVAGADVFAAGHPVPDENGLKAADAIEEMLSETGPRDQVLALVSGGGSALLPAPVEGVTLAEKAQVNRLLLGAGLDITAMNAVRQHLSRLKGGGLLRAASPAPVTALILSDVIGDDLRVIASGPTASPILSRAEAVALLKTHALWERLPANARAALTRPEDRCEQPEVTNRLIGSNALSIAAMAQACPAAHASPEPLVGDVATAAARIAALADAGPGITLLGGEATVRLRGSGLGGRNQELALRVALALEGRAGWRFLSAGTDGRDGPTDAAGAVVDGQTAARIRHAGGDPEALLANNDSHEALKLAGDLLITGGTGTNVADLQIFSRA